MSNNSKRSMKDDGKFGGITFELDPRDIAQDSDLKKLEEKIDLKIDNLKEMIKNIPNETQVSIDKAFKEDKNARNDKFKFYIGTIIFGVINILISIFL